MTFGARNRMTHGGETVLTFCDLTLVTVSMSALRVRSLLFLTAGRGGSCTRATISFTTASFEWVEASGFCLGFFFFWNETMPVI